MSEPASSGLTVLFADFSGFTAFSEGVDVEDVHALAHEAAALQLALATVLELKSRIVYFAGPHEGELSSGPSITFCSSLPENRTIQMDRL